MWTGAAGYSCNSSFLRVSSFQDLCSRFCLDMHCHGRQKHIREQKKHLLFLKTSAQKAHISILLARATDMTKPDDVRIGWVKRIYDPLSGVEAAGSYKQ